MLKNYIKSILCCQLIFKSIIIYLQYFIFYIFKAHILPLAYIMILWAYVQLNKRHYPLYYYTIHFRLYYIVCQEYILYYIPIIIQKIVSVLELLN